VVTAEMLKGETGVYVSGCIHNLFSKAETEKWLTILQFTLLTRELERIVISFQEMVQDGLF
jgi:hypothetical protein